MYRVYVIQNQQGRFYIGLSDDVDRRVSQHNDGVSQWTRNKGPWSLVWQSDSMPLTEARKLENLLKKKKGGTGFYAMTGLTRHGGPSGS